MPSNFVTRKLLAWGLLIVGLVLVFLGYEDTFGFIGCGPGAVSCIRVYSLDIIAAIMGLVAILTGIFMMTRWRADTRSEARFPEKPIMSPNEGTLNVTSSMRSSFLKACSKCGAENSLAAEKCRSCDAKI